MNALALLVRYRLKAVLRLRPRPDGAYWYAGARGMVDDVLPMQLYLLDALRKEAEGSAPPD